MYKNYTYLNLNLLLSFTTLLKYESMFILYLFVYFRGRRICIEINSGGEKHTTLDGFCN